MTRAINSLFQSTEQPPTSLGSSTVLNSLRLRTNNTSKLSGLMQRASNSSGSQQPLGEISLQRATPSKKGNTDGVIRLGQKLKSTLSRLEKSDIYQLKNLKPGQQVEIQVNTKKFFSGLNLVNGRTGEVILRSYWRSETDKSAHLYFVPKRGVQYQLRVARDDDRPRGAGQYQLKVSKLSNPDPTFNFFYGAGTVDAATAVSRAIGQPSFTEVADLGGDNWNLDLIKAPEVWARGFTGRGVTVAVIGNGVDLSHPDLQGNLWTNTREIASNGIDDDGNGFIDDLNGWNFIDSNNNVAHVNPQQGSGTYIAGAIAAVNNGVGTTGVAPDAKIMAIRVDKAGSNLSTTAAYAQEDVAKGIRYAVDNGAKVVHLGFSYPAYESASQIQPALETALLYARQAGAVVVLTAGGDRQYNSPDRPGELGYFAAVRDLGIAVGGVDRNRNLAVSGNPAGLNRIDYVVAPAVDVKVTTMNGNYETVSRSNIASAHVSGVAALMLSANPSLTPSQVEQILTETANSQGITITP